MGHRPQIAFTFDDPSTDSNANLEWQEINHRILDSLAKHKIKSALFVCGKRVNSDAGHHLLADWDGQGHLICNHSYSHFNFNGSITLEQFESDALKNEPLLRGFTNRTFLFRYPFFKEGDTVAKRDGMRSFLQERGYRIGRATIDASDWAIDARLARRVQAAPNCDLSGYRAFLLQHIWERAQFYELLALQLSPEPVRHTVLLHHNALNAHFVADLIAMFIENKWNPVDAEYAYGDAIYDKQPKILPAGESLLWALAEESGKFRDVLRYPGEDDVYENPKMDALGL